MWSCHSEEILKWNRGGQKDYVAPQVVPADTHHPLRDRRAELNSVVNLPASGTLASQYPDALRKRTGMPSALHASASGRAATGAVPDSGVCAVDTVGLQVYKTYSLRHRVSGCRRCDADTLAHPVRFGVLLYPSMI